MINFDQLSSVLFTLLALTMLVLGLCRFATGRSAIGFFLVAAAAFLIPRFVGSVADVFPRQTTTAPVTFDNLSGWWWVAILPMLAMVVVPVLVTHWPDRSHPSPQPPACLHRARWYLAGDGPVGWLTHPQFFRDAQTNRWVLKVNAEVAGSAETERLCEQIVAAWHSSRRDDIDPALVDGDPTRLAMLQQALELLHPPATATQRAVAARLILTADPQGMPAALTTRLTRWVWAAPGAIWPTLADNIPGTVTEGGPPEACHYETYPPQGADRDRW